LEMKQGLMITYAKYLAFYQLLKLEGKEVAGHPVIKRLVQLKMTMEKLRPLEQKMQYQVDKYVRQAAIAEAQGEQAYLESKEG